MSSQSSSRLTSSRLSSLKTGGLVHKVSADFSSSPWSPCGTPSHLQGKQICSIHQVHSACHNLSSTTLLEYNNCPVWSAFPGCHSSLGWLSTASPWTSGSCYWGHISVLEFLLDPSSWLQGIDNVVSSAMACTAHAVSALLDPYLASDYLLSHWLFWFSFQLIVCWI